MKANIVLIKNIDQFYKTLTKIGRSDSLACRGQPSDFGKGRLWSSIGRIPKRAMAYKLRQHVERLIAKRFRQSAPNHLPVAELPQASGGYGLLVLMQHYGAPTRLLDWTESIWIAAYFAARDKWCEPGIIYAFDRLEFEDRVKSRFEKEINDAFTGQGQEQLPAIFYGSYRPWVSRLVPTRRRIPRFIAQKGLFTIGSRLDIDHWAFVEEMLGTSRRKPKTWVIRIAKEIKPKVLKELDRMGINGSALFPDIDGVGRSLTEFAHYAKHDQAVLDTMAGG